MKVLKIWLGHHLKSILLLKKQPTDVRWFPINSTSIDGKVNPKLGADGFTFTTEIDATDSESYTHFDLPGQLESNSTDYWMKFSSTDIFLSEGVSWTFIEGAELSEVNEVPADLVMTPRKDWNGTHMTCRYTEESKRWGLRFCKG